MGKDDKQRRKGNAQGASSSRAAELLQKSGFNVNFLGFNAADSGLNLGLGDAEERDDYADLDAKVRVIFRKFGKREANTREKALKSLAETVVEDPGSSNCFKAFVGVYSKLIFDPSTAVRIASNEALAVFIKTFKGKIAADVVTVIPFLLLSTFDHITAVKKSALDLLEQCFETEKREKIYQQFTAGTIEICLEMVKRRHNSMGPQKFEDLENYNQRCERLISQALSFIENLIEKFDDKQGIFKVLEAEFDKLIGMGPAIQGKLMKVFLVYMKLESFEDVLKSKVCGKIVKLMDSPNESVSQHAFSCYLYMANAVGNGQGVNFSLRDFVCVPVQRMVSRKASHYKSLEHCLLPLVIIVIKGMEDQKELKEWIQTLLKAFFDGEMPANVFLHWAKSFADVIEILNLKYLEKEYDDDIAESVEEAVVKFLHIYLTKEEEDLKENGKSIEEIALRLIINQSSEKGNKKVVDFINLALSNIFYNLPKSEGFILKLWDHREDKTLDSFIFYLGKEILEGDSVSSDLYIKVLSCGCYKEWEEIDFGLFKTSILERMKEMKEINDVLFEGFRYLVEKNRADGKELFGVIDLRKMKHAVKLLLLTEEGASSLFNCDDRERILSIILNGLPDNPTLFKINGFKSSLLGWINETKTENIYSIIRDLSSKVNVPALTKLINVVVKVDEVPSKLLDDLSRAFVHRLVNSEYEEFPEEGDKESLDWFLTQHQTDLHLISSVLDCECPFDNIDDFYGTVAKGFDGIFTILNLFEQSKKDILELSFALDSYVASHVLAKEPVAHAFAFASPSNLKSKDLDETRRILKDTLIKAAFYKNLEAEHVTQNMKLHLVLLYAASTVYVDSVHNDGLRKLLINYMKGFEEFFKNWNEEDRGSIIRAAVGVYLGEQLSFTFMYGLKRLKSDWSHVRDKVMSSSLSQDHKLGLEAVLNNDFILDIPDIIEKREFLPFIVSLEKQTQKLKENIRNEDVAIVLLAELKEKFEKTDSVWLFTSTGDLDRDLLSCAVLRLAVQLVGRLPDLPQELRDFVLCGLITAMQDFTAKEERSQLSEVMASLSLEFFTSYDRKLGDKLNELKSLPEVSEEVLENKLLVESQIQEWREFFGSSASTYTFAWFCWMSVGNSKGKVNYGLFSPFLRLQMAEFIDNPSPLMTQNISGRNLLTADEIFDCLVDLLFSPVAELQLLAIFLLQNLVLTHFTIKDELDDQLKKMLQTSESLPSCNGDEEESERNAIEYKLSRFFDNVINKLTSFPRSPDIDPCLIIWDLLIRTVKLLDSQQSAEFCAQINSEVIGGVLEAVTRHLPLDKNVDEVREIIEKRPDDVFSFWKIPFDVDDSKRVVDDKEYSLWLYYRSLETLPALVREWIGPWKNENLKRFTALSLSPILIEEELNKIGNVKTKSGFSVRSRPSTKEIVARYQVEELTLETTIKLPDDYPLSQVTIVHDKRNIIAKGMTHKLHLNLFSYVNTRNGAICDAVLQWKKNVEKQIAGVEDCSICMMTVSSRNYRMPDLKCRQCFKKFHSDCMLKWIQTSTKPTCPLCRNEFY
ncbi:unnamed protein product [Bursaphelenchus xylophilus]|uniref:E3 ubiquitin-protein ligase listerin n=1 Tax=Bursaphelenchus xylophilus TaxID=6326 RepID=A0A7I8X1V2_BURXY|nr:unnamed protein product [Bursaphelenchus xylophilus]CAG9130766.1 unnamed protein product [Bursaphelenchus xylophilus]